MAKKTDRQMNKRKLWKEESKETLQIAKPTMSTKELESKREREREERRNKGNSRSVT